MNYIRVRVAIILCASMLVVVGLSSLVMSRLVIDRVDKNFRTEFTQRVGKLTTALTIDGSAAMFHLDDRPAEGKPLPAETKELTDSFRKAGLSHSVQVVELASGMRVATINFGRGNITWPFPNDVLPAQVWYGVVGYIALITMGVVFIALFVAFHATKQLRLLESMAQKVVADGALPRIPEEGTAEIKATARALNRMGDSIKRLIDSKMRLVAAAGHDLRTPMTRMRLRAEFLDDEARADWLRDLDEMDRIADSAIQLVREETTSQGVEIVQVDELVRRVCNDVSSIELPVMLTSVCRATVQAAPLALTRALRNLIINAATHGEGASVRMQRHDRMVQIIIEDNGPGIPIDDLSNAFEPFFRVDPARRQHVPGAGLGLAIAKEIVERQGGSLKIANRTPQGLRQVISFAMTADIKAVAAV